MTITYQKDDFIASITSSFDVSISGGTVPTITFMRPDGSSFGRTAIIVGPDSKDIRYKFASGDLDIAGH